MLILTLVGALALGGACGDTTSETPLADFQLVGIDFELDSILLTNNGTDEVRTRGLWVYQDGESSQFNVFIIEPRATILFSLRDIGGVDVSGGEIALYQSDSFSDPEAMLDYVAWGSTGHSQRGVATDAGLWGGEEAVETSEDTLVIVRVDPTGSGPLTWEASSEVP